MNEEYLEQHFHEILEHESEIEVRMTAADCSIASLKKDNRFYIDGFQSAGERIELIDSDFDCIVKELLD